jgi:hypothetical protein
VGTSLGPMYVNPEELSPFWAHLNNKYGRRLDAWSYIRRDVVIIWCGDLFLWWRITKQRNNFFKVGTSDPSPKRE